MLLGRPSQDVRDTLARFDEAAAFNKRIDADKLKHVRVYLEDTARKWSRVQENQWKGAAVPMIWSDFTKEFLEAFQHNHIPSMLLARLQARKQQPSESAIDYYYDVLDLCRQIDEMSEVKMTETTRVHYQVY